MEFVKAVEENFKLMVLEVTKQLEDTVRLLGAYSKQLAEKVRSRDDYIDTMKNIVENKNFSFVAGVEKVDKKTLHNMWAVNTIVHNLEHVADLAVNIADQSGYFSEEDYIKRYDYGEYFKKILDSIALVPKALFTSSINQALKICRAEYELDALYAADLKHIIEEMRFSRDAGNLVTAMFILQCAERMGDSVLNIGEAIISLVMGERMKIHQFQALENTLSTAEEKQRISEFSLESVGDTRSGSTIRKVYEPGKDPSSSRWVVFKEGLTSKLSKEKENMEAWEKIAPGLPPGIFGYQANGRTASIILEYLSGKNMKDVVINEKSGNVKEAMAIVKATLEKVWNATLKKQPVKAMYMEQLASRIGDVYRVHPDFMHRESRIGGLEVASFEDMLKTLTLTEKKIEAPFSTFIHGDFNIDNIIYNAAEKRINFIDLHRSSYNDYVQDVSVFIVSNFRMPIFEQSIRRKLNNIINDFYSFAADFARSKNDSTFDARLAFGLIRSFVTSTRFEFNREFAKMMYLRSVYLTEKILAHGNRPWEEFSVQKDIFIY
ncbi:MAG: PhoU domain-containing protein [Candidatus Goldiibacteriota bacterium]